MEAKPHCGLRARFSSRTKRDASSMRLRRVAWSSRRGVFELTRPRTTVFAFRDEAERFECSGALVVIFEQEAVYFESGEQFFGDRVVTSFRVPVAPIITAAEMDSERDSVLFCGAETFVVCADGLVESLVRVKLHFGSYPFAPFRVHVIAIAWCVNLDVGHAFGRQLLQIALHDFDNVPEQRGVIFVDFVCDAAFEGDCGELRGAGKCDFDGNEAVRLQEGKFMAG